MSNDKQISINWLIEQLQKTRDYQRVINEANQSTTSVRDIIEQSRKMYQDEIEAAIHKADHYYNETYNKNK